MQFFQLAPELLLAFGYFFGDIDLNNNIKIAAFARGARQTASAQTKSLSTQGAWRNFQAHVAFESGHDQFGAKHCLPWRDFHLVNEIATLDYEIRMSRQTHTKEKIAAFSSARACFALTAQSDSLSFMNSARDFNLVSFHLI